MSMRLCANVCLMCFPTAMRVVATSPYRQTRGFEVVSVLDQPRAGVAEAFQHFCDTMSDACEMVVVTFAGHGCGTDDVFLACQDSNCEWALAPFAICARRNIWLVSAAWCSRAAWCIWR